MALKLGKVRDSVQVPIFNNVFQTEAPEDEQKRYENGQFPTDAIYRSFFVTNRVEWASRNGEVPAPEFYLTLRRLTGKANKIIAELLDGGEALVQRNRRGEPAFARRTISNVKQLEAQDKIYDLCIEGWEEVFDELEKPLKCVGDTKNKLVEQVPGLGDFILAFCRDPRNFGEDKATQEKKEPTSDAT